MQTLTNAELAFLAVLGHQELTKMALKLYAKKVYIFTDMIMPHLGLMWTSYVALLKKNKEKYGLSLSRDMIAAELIEAVQADKYLNEELKNKCDIILQRLVSGAVPSIDEGQLKVQSLVQLDNNRKMMEKLNANADLQILQQTLDASRQALDTVDGASASHDDGRPGIVFNPFKDIEKLAVKSDRVPTGIKWLDDISSGGGRAGDLWLILGAPAGGKTAMCVQYVCSQALLANTTMWVTYEQSLEGDIAERMIANVTDTSLDKIRDVGFKNLPKELQELFWSTVAGYDDRLIALDMTKLQPDGVDPEDYGGVKSIWKRFKELKENGHPPKTVILDWFGSMMSRIASNRGLDLSKNYRFLAQEEINTLIQFARQEQILIIVFHQLDVKAASARPTYLADATHAQDMHNMQNFFDLVAILGIKDVNNVCYFSNPKNRKGQRVVRTLRLIGDRSKFVMEEGWMPNRDGNFYRPADISSKDDFNSAASEYTRELE